MLDPIGDEPVYAARPVCVAEDAEGHGGIVAFSRSARAMAVASAADT